MEINDDVPPHSDGTLFQEVGPKHLFKSCVNPEARSVHDRKTSATKRDAEKSATAGFLRFSASRLSLHRSERLVIIGLLRDLGHQFGIDDFAVPVDDHHRTSQQPFQRAIGHQHAVALIERGFRNPTRERHSRFPRPCKTRMSERQVFRNGQHDRSRQLRREFVELTHRRGANARIEARKIFRITCFPRKSFRERVERSVLTNSKSGAAAPALTNSPAICTGCPLNFVIDISLFLFNY